MRRLTSACRLAGLWLAVHGLFALAECSEPRGRRYVAVIAVAVVLDLLVIAAAAVACGGVR